MQFDTVVPSHVPVELSSTKPPSGRSRSIRKRKFESQDDFQKDQEFQQMAKRSKTVDMEGPFWFEEGSVEIGENHEKIQHGITNRERQLLKEIVKTNFETEDRLKTTLVPLNDESSKSPRLRAFDWAVTNFAKGRPQLLQIGSTIVDPNLDEQNELKREHRLLFDPFRRGTHIFYETTETDASGNITKTTHRTTVGQLSFVKWCLEHGVDKYVEEHLDEIRDHMHTTSKNKPKDRMRRRELTKAPKRLVRGCVHAGLDVTKEKLFRRNFPKQMDWGFASVAPAATVLSYVTEGRSADWAVLNVLNLLEMVLLILLAFQALEQRPNNIVTQPGQVFFNSGLVVGFYIVATFVYAVRVLSVENTGPFDLVPFFLYLTLALQIKQNNGRIVSWLLFAIASWRFAWEAESSFELHRVTSLRKLLSDTKETDNALGPDELADLAEQMQEGTSMAPALLSETAYSFNSRKL